MATGRAPKLRCRMRVVGDGRRRRSDPMAQIRPFLDCGSCELHARGRCSTCYWRTKREAVIRTLPGCQRPWIPRPEDGLCGMCVRRTRPTSSPRHASAVGCGRPGEQDGHGLCSACYQKGPARLPTWTAGAMGRLDDAAPPWFAPPAEDLADSCAPPSRQRTCTRSRGLSPTAWVYCDADRRAARAGTLAWCHRSHGR